MASAPGTNTVRHGIFHSELADRVPHMKQMVVPAAEQLLSSRLQAGGYDTAYLGKWHLGESEGFRPQDRGFDKFVGFLPGAGLYMPYGSPEVVSAAVDGEPSDDFLRINSVFAVEDHEGHRFAPNEYMTDYFAHQAAQAIEQQARSRADGPAPPLFLVAAFNAPHNPFQALRSDFEDPEVAAIGTHHGRVYGAMVKALDRGVGVILDAVRRHHPAGGENTLVIFTSDNGGALYTGPYGTNTPYRGGKGTFFEGDGAHLTRGRGSA